MDIVYWHEFDGWWNIFSYSPVLILESAKAIDSSGHLLAEATMVKIDRRRRRIIFRETHYYPEGKIRFQCLSSYGVGSKYKLEESEQKGKKKKEFFFILPV